MIIFAMLIVQCLMNMYTFWLIPWIELTAGILHVLLFIVFAVVLTVMAPKHTANFVFFDKASTSGWSNSFVTWNLGLLTPAWGFVGKLQIISYKFITLQCHHSVSRLSCI